MASLEIPLWSQDIQSPLQFCQISNFESQIQFSNKSCHWIILQPSHTLENLKINSPQSLPIHPLTHLAHNHLPIHSSNFSVTRLNAFVPNFPLLIPPDPYLFPITPPNLSNFNSATFTEIRNLFFLFSKQAMRTWLDSYFPFKTLLQWTCPYYH